ncbi:hypothetical protein PPACK8108_LOCUS2332 [Phakopsora pachyrhizi]|uniref:Uncharacterized protein n=1 Tax=Phakopsora pachyrhizi TaxID=170000 RepID=A0AAV0AJF4_PHAPC|nr:hypothetical protein PPACK8108_LOCUS2332 [Phakopsora pachyrhizi]
MPECGEGGGPILDGRDDMGKNGAGRLEGKVTASVFGLFDQIGMGVEEDRGEVAGDGAQWPQLILGMSSADSLVVGTNRPSIPTKPPVGTKEGGAFQAATFTSPLRPAFDQPSRGRGWPRGRDFVLLNQPFTVKILKEED